VTAGANTQVVRYVPHAQILPSAALVGKFSQSKHSTRRVR
jgi:hypothetical protein